MIVAEMNDHSGLVGVVRRAAAPRRPRSARRAPPSRNRSMHSCGGFISLYEPLGEFTASTSNADTHSVGTSPSGITNSSVDADFDVQLTAGVRDGRHQRDRSTPGAGHGACALSTAGRRRRAAPPRRLRRRRRRASTRIDTPYLPAGSSRFVAAATAGGARRRPKPSQTPQHRRGALPRRWQRRHGSAHARRPRRCTRRRPAVLRRAGARPPPACAASR